MRIHVVFGVAGLIVGEAARPGETVIGALPLGWRINAGPSRVVMLGLGWDPEHPARPWPRLTHRADRWCLSLAGVFVNYRYTGGAA